MMGRTTFLGAAVLAAITASVSAQQTQTYAYDVHGRLTGVTRTTGSAAQTTTYALDKANNRTSRATGASTTTFMDPTQVQSVDPREASAELEVEAPTHPETGTPSTSPDALGGVQ